MKKLIATPEDAVMLVLRLALGIVIFPHGAQKVLGWFGGHGFEATLQGFTNMMGVPAPFAILALAAEFLGALGLIFGFLTRIAAFGIFCVMVVAIFKVHLGNGFFMNWEGQVPPKEGIEYHLLAIGLALALMIRGGGLWSVDRALTRSQA